MLEVDEEASNAAWIQASSAVAKNEIWMLILIKANAGF